MYTNAAAVLPNATAVMFVAPGARFFRPVGFGGSGAAAAALKSRATSTDGVLVAS